MSIHKTNDMKFFIGDEQVVGYSIYDVIKKEPKSKTVVIKLDENGVIKTDWTLKSICPTDVLPSIGGGYFFLDQYGEHCGPYEDEWEANKLWSIFMCDNDRFLYIDVDRFIKVRKDLFL